MTDTSYPVTAIPAHPHTAAPLLQNGQLAAQLPLSAQAIDGTPDDDGQISCECGYPDDDGWTVACDSCNRWQHQLCYYPQYEDQPLPDDLQHYCVDCRPRPFDRQGAHARQKVKREEQASLVNGIKRAAASRSHKKKPKEQAYTNGWPLDRARHDRNSASPRDQPPPAKRPKTSHRTSDSTTSAPTTTKGHSRKRTASNVHHRRSLSRSPDANPSLYSREFIQRYRDDDWAETRANLHNSIDVADSLSEWLNISDEKFRETHGHHKSEVLMRWDGELDDIPGKADIEIQEVTDDRVPLADGPPDYVTWKTLTVKEPVASGAYIGELKGHVGFKEDYTSEPSNRWSLLRHPEPFVFFHPKLPIYVDARDEGTQLRYVRRSCSPNAQLQVLVTDAQDYRFCFMAIKQIDPGMEIAVAWDTSHGFMLHNDSNGSELDLRQFSVWVSNVLSNCGPCACQLGSDCSMARFDRRLDPTEADAVPPAKATKSKGRKARQNISPLNTQVHSRSGSEARKVEPDDEPTDSRSASGSAGRNSISRDITPNTHYSHNGSLSAMPELSERERKKLAKEEEMFRRQEEEQTSGRQSKKKRLSGGSNLNTPSATSSKQSGFDRSSKYADAGTSKQAGLPPAKTGVRRAKGSATPKARKTITRVVKRPKPDYVDAEVQCDLDAEETPVQMPVRRRTFLSTTQRLLQRCALNNSKRKLAEDPFLLSSDDRMDVDKSPPSHSSPPPTLSSPRSASLISAANLPAKLKREHDQAQDTEMEDAPPADVAIAATSSPSITGDLIPGPTASDSSSSAQDLPTNPPAPPWPSQASHTTTPLNDITSSRHIPSSQQPAHTHKPEQMHLEMPPPPSNHFVAATPATATILPGEANNEGPLSSTPQPLIQSPLSTLPSTTSSTGAAIASTGNPSAVSSSSTTAAGAPLSNPAVNAAPPLFSPTVTAAVNPSPARKKLSLSDYTRRSKAKDSRDGEPAAAASSASNGSSAGAAAATASASTSSLKTESEAEAGKDKEKDGAVAPAGAVPAVQAIKSEGTASPVLVAVSASTSEPGPADASRAAVADLEVRMMDAGNEETVDDDAAGADADDNVNVAATNAVDAVGGDAKAETDAAAAATTDAEAKTSAAAPAVSSSSTIAVDAESTPPVPPPAASATTSSSDTGAAAQD